MQSGINRLLCLREENNAAGEEMRQEQKRIETIANRHFLGTAPRAVIGFNLFQTPENVAERMAGILRERVTGGRILEPSVGLGRLYRPLADLQADWVMIEEARECVTALRAMLKREVQERDFLQVSDIGQFDGVIMNPPFKQGKDIKHILHAYDMLKTGGRLVSLCYNGVKQNEQLKPIASRWEALPEGSFKSEGTSASVAILVMDK